jgi:hypothetical protein
MNIDEKVFALGEDGIEAEISGETFGGRNHKVWFRLAGSADPADLESAVNGVFVEVGPAYLERVKIAVWVDVGADLGFRDLRVTSTDHNGAVVDNFTLANAIEVVKVRP